MKNQTIQKLMRNKKFMCLLIFGVVIFLASSVYAVYYLNYSGTRTITITDDIGRITFTDNFEIDSYSSPNEDQVLELKSIYIENPSNTTYEYLLTYNTTFTGTGDFCEQENDVIFGMQNGYTGLGNNSSLSFAPGSHELWSSTRIKALACAGEYVFNLQLDPL